MATMWTLGLLVGPLLFRNDIVMQAELDSSLSEVVIRQYVLDGFVPLLIPRARHNAENTRHHRANTGLNMQVLPSAT